LKLLEERLKCPKTSEDAPTLANSKAIPCDILLTFARPETSDFVNPRRVLVVPESGV